MSPFRKALFAADFSGPSREVYRMAYTLAQSPDSKVIVLHVVEPGPGHGGPVAFGKAGALPPLIHECGSPPEEEILAKLQQAYPPDPRVDVEYRVRHGTAAGEILRAAQDLGADLIALGTHGRSGILRMVLGSVAEEVLRRAPCPVITMGAAVPVAATAAGAEPALAR